MDVQILIYNNPVIDFPLINIKYRLKSSVWQYRILVDHNMAKHTEMKCYYRFR